MADYPQDVILAARQAIAAHVRDAARGQYLEGRHDNFAMIRALCDAILAERGRRQGELLPLLEVCDRVEWWLTTVPGSGEIVKVLRDAIIAAKGGSK